MNRRKVSDWMSQSLHTIDEDASVIEAFHMMKERGVRRLPVMRNGRLCGIVTDRMLKDYSPSKASMLDQWEAHYLLSKTPVNEAMNPKPFTVDPDAPLTEAAKIIRENRLYGLCVVDRKGDLVGIVTTKDLIDALIYFSGEEEN